MKSEDELRRERRRALVAAGILMALAVPFYVTINGRRLHEPYTMLTPPEVLALRTFGPLTVAPGHYCLLGRYQGTIAGEDIRGRMFYVLHVGQCEE